MKKFVRLEELNTDNILDIGRKNEDDYQICVEDIDGHIGLQDEESLEELLSDGGVVFIEADDAYYYYELNGVKFKVPYETINEDSDGCADTYLFFDLKTQVN